MRRRKGLTLFMSAANLDDGGSRKGSKGNAVHVRAHNPAAVPATVSGELATEMPLEAERLLGRRSKATTRKPGDLPPAAVTRERIGRGVLM